MTGKPIRWAAVAMALTLASGCGDEAAQAPDDTRFDPLPAAEPIELAQLDTGVGVRSGEAISFAINVPNNYKQATALLPHAMLHLQTYDELTQQFGEFTYYQAPGDAQGRGAADYRAQSSLGNIDQRAGALIDELDRAGARADSAAFAQRSMVVDFYRVRRDWFVRWDGALSEEANRVGKSSYGFGRSAMVQTLATLIERAVQQVQPEYLILGDEMELLLATSEGEGLSEGEYASFIGFYQELVPRIKAVSPNTRVGMGINWDRFATRVALRYSDKTSASELTDRDLARAFDLAIAPTLAVSDFLALRSAAAPGDEATGRYQFLRRLPALYERELPVVFYAITSPITANAQAQLQRNYLDDFVRWNAGVDVEAVFWDRLVNMDGTNTTDQQLAGRCLALTGDMTRNLLAPRSICYNGLYDALFQAKPVTQAWRDALGQ